MLAGALVSSTARLVSLLSFRSRAAPPAAAAALRRPSNALGALAGQGLQIVPFQLMLSTFGGMLVSRSRKKQLKLS